MPNLLHSEPSAYLQSAAHQPVHWLPWGEAAFAQAARTDRPILLDIGAVWCHWCHVMDRESYEDPSVADLLNRNYVCIKVDRDERPDVDARYQRGVQALTGQGGWPLTAFLTPQGEVFFGGTYFPPEPNPYGRPGFLTVLAHVARLYREERSKIAENAKAITRHVAGTLDETQAGGIEPAVLDAVTAQLARAFDVRHGGFGGAPKFPHPAACEFLLARWYDTHEGWTREVVEKTLDGMARGGIRDHLGGGFHRYATDERWIVPHFEKMAYDNSELLKAYASAAAALGAERYRAVAADIVDWVLTTLADASGGAFYASQDADVGPDDDGDYWTWTPDEARAVLTEAEFDVVRQVFDVEPQGEMRHNPAKNVLWWKRDPAGEEDRTLLQQAVGKLKAARDRRPTPQVDRTPYVNWNAMMASAFLQAGAALDRPPCNTLALKVLERIWAEAWEPAAGMSHVIGRAHPGGMLDDHVQSAVAFLDAYEATGREEWLKRAAAVMTYCGSTYWDEEGGGYYDLPATGEGARGGPYLDARAKPVQDAPTPSPNGVAALALARLWALTDAAHWRARLDRQLAAFGGVAAELGLHGATLLRAVDWALHPITRIEVSGPSGEGATCAMHLLALQTYRPRKAVVRRIVPSPSATVCVGTTCSLPAETPDALRELLA